MRGLVAVLGLSLIAGAGHAQTVTSAAFADETTRYGHAILGDAVEYGTLVITSQTQAGATITHRVVLPQDHVFEDIAPRLWDVTGDGAPEVMVIETDVNAGAALAIYGPRGKIAETPHIGQRNRWLSPIGAADLDRDGHIEIAYIDRPHLAKVLRVWRWTNDKLTEVASISGLTTHKIGQDFLQGAVLDCGGRMAVLTADANWQRKIATTFDGATLKSEDMGPYTGPDSLSRC
ncbi:VCBS repeat-containing protein [Nereida sp. MMG025]|uniref:FG-GAP repeat domain-containing protein n=1 Tax=Nereida sp. MMG025 TaxID=2909981 RepID=UPI001F2A5677|nr:VCBS repeat-containing protein [Nereida sp. MMG025]MCF6443810.1 VCBS repeat-containing protein [Nereida sp. MMG025]